MIFASATIDVGSGPVSIAAWLGCLAFTITLINGAVKLADRVRGKPGKPPNEQLAVIVASLEARVEKMQPVTRTEFDRAQDENSREHENLFSKMGGVERGMLARMETAFLESRKERAAEVGKVRDEIAGVSREVGALRAVNDLQSQRLAGIDSKLDRVIERRQG